mmetsp:Transcript_1181/g.3125  ORF Transcript_1181/g.3125 Transcript_1181/m.3125 type:complete len:214 (+) Transcript_1181:757-1398(+)
MRAQALNGSSLFSRRRELGGSGFSWNRYCSALKSVGSPRTFTVWRRWASAPARSKASTSGALRYCIATKRAGMGASSSASGAFRSAPLSFTARSSLASASQALVTSGADPFAHLLSRSTAKYTANSRSFCTSGVSTPSTRLCASFMALVRHRNRTFRFRNSLVATFISIAASLAAFCISASASAFPFLCPSSSALWNFSKPPAIFHQTVTDVK